MGAVKLNPPVTVVGLIALALGAVAWTRGSGSTKRDIRCDVAIAGLSYFFKTMEIADKSKPVIVSAIPERFVGPMPEEAVVGELSYEVRREPLLGLYKQLARQEGTSAVGSCPAVVEFLREQKAAGNVISDEKTSNPQTPDGILKYPVVLIGMPAVDIHRGEAIMGVSRTSGSLDGIGVEVYLRRNDFGEWRVIYITQRWVS